VILLTGLAVVVGLRRAPDYTAEAKLALSANAGGTAGLAGFAANSQTLTAGFAQAVDAPKVVGRISGKTGLSAAEVRSQVTASSTADSPVVRVQATSPTTGGAKSAANAASVALAGYVNQLNRSGGAQQRLLKEFQAATVRVDAAKAQLTEARSSGADPATVSKASAALDAAKLTEHAASTAYQTSQENSTSVGDLQVLSRAGGATSDRARKLELLVFIGLIVGVAVGATLATIRANR
jgi:capsular polysaccharide biosynthesis protein